MQVAQDTLVALFVAMGYKTATKWKLEQLTTQVNKIHSLADDDAAELEPSQEKLLKKLIKAAKTGTEISVVASSAASSGKDEEETKPVKKGKKPVKKEEPEETEEESEESEVEEETKPVKKGKKAASAPEPQRKGPGRPASGEGVIATIAKLVQKATAKNPITKEKIHEALVEKFPDRSSDSMWSTVNIQIPNRLNREKGLNIKKNDKGYYVEN